MNIYRLMANIVITTNDKVRQFSFQVIYVIMKIAHVHKLMVQPVYVCTRWQVKAHYRKSIKIEPKVTALKIHVFYTCSVNNIVGFVLRKYGNATIAFFLCRKPVMVRVSCFFYLIDGHLVVGCFYLL